MGEPLQNVTFSPLPSTEEKRAALAQVLQTTTFVRSGQLRAFLSYVCETELAGRGAELSEHLIGVEALGRPPGYSTGEDSSVRRQAHALRQKLDELYAGELAGASVRIQLPRGSYVPRYLRAPFSDREASEEERLPDDVRRRRGRGPARATMAALVVAAFAAGALGSFVFLQRGRRASAFDPVLLEAWGPLARPGANVVVCLATHGHLGVLPYPEAGPLPPWVWRPPPEEEAEIQAWYRQHYPLPPRHRLALHKTTGPIRLGEVRGLAAAVRLLDRAGVDVEIVAGKNVALPDLRGRNLLLFGNPEYSVAVAKLLERAELTIAYDPERRERVVQSRRSDGPLSVYTPNRDSEELISEAFGIVTVMRGGGAGGGDPTQTVIVSCTNSAGCQAAMEYFSSASKMTSLRDRLRAAGLAGFPPAYQVVVRCRVHSAQAISAEYHSHVVSPPDSTPFAPASNRAE